MAGILPINIEPVMDRGSRMLISAGLAVCDPIRDQPEPFNNLFFNGNDDKNPYSVFYSRPEDAENTINFVNQNWAMNWDWNISTVFSFIENGLPHVVIVPLYSQRGLIENCHQILTFISDLVNFGLNPVQSMTTHIQQTILEQVNLNMRTFQNIEQLTVVGYAISSLVIGRPDLEGGEDDQDHELMPSSDDESSDDGSSSSGDGSSSMYSSGSDSGPHHPSDMEWDDDDWSMSSSSDSGYFSHE